jgi:hypothetical protein
MMPFVMGDLNTVPEEYRHYAPLLEACPMDEGNIGFLTIHESFTEQRRSQRRIGLHVEKPAVILHEGGEIVYREWGAGIYGPSGRLFGGIFMASNIAESTQVWDVQISEDGIGVLGDVEHFRDLLGEGTKLRAEELCWITDTTPHESLPLLQDAYRQYFRLVTSTVSVWYEQHSTKNRLGVVPDPRITQVVSHDKFGGVVPPPSRESTMLPAAPTDWSHTFWFEAVLLEGPHAVVGAYDGVEESEAGGLEGGYLPVGIGELVRILCIAPYEGHGKNRFSYYGYGSVAGHESRQGWLPTEMFAPGI